MYIYLFFIFTDLAHKLTGQHSKIYDKVPLWRPLIQKTGSLLSQFYDPKTAIFAFGVLIFKDQLVIKITLGDSINGTILYTFISELSNY